MSKTKKAYAVFKYLGSGEWKKTSLNCYTKDRARETWAKLTILYPGNTFKIQEVDSWLLRIFG